MKQDYGGVIWTDHALSRLRKRNIKQGDAWATFRRPDSSRRGKQKGIWVYYRTWLYKKKDGKSKSVRIEVVATKNTTEASGKWVILSVWSKQIKGQKTQKRSFITKLLSMFK